MLVSTFVWQRTAPFPRRRRRKETLAYLRRREFCLPIRKIKLLEQTCYKSPTILRAAARIRNRRKLIAQDLQDLFHGLLTPWLAQQGRFRSSRPNRHRRHTAKSQPRLGDDIALIEINPEARRDRADVHFSALGNLEPFNFAPEAGRATARNDDSLQDFPRLQSRLAIRHKEFVNRQCTFALQRHEHHTRIQRH